MTAWLVVSLVQTFVIIPVIVWRSGKGAYCGWICSCGALAETLGDAHRHKMPHGPRWNRWNMLGQAILALCLLLLALRVVAWITPDSALGNGLRQVHEGLLYGWSVAGIPVNYSYLVDLMHIYARCSSFRILADKKKCISCNVCTSVCHQGIDIMSFANKGEPMADPECVRCSACVESCPTGVLEFGRVDGGGQVIHTDRLTASPVRAREDVGTVD